jgi:hypothetical protein
LTGHDEFLLQLKDKEKNRNAHRILVRKDLSKQSLGDQELNEKITFRLAICALLCYYAEYSGNSLDLMTLQDGINSLSRNVSKT